MIRKKIEKENNAINSILPQVSDKLRAVMALAIKPVMDFLTLWV